MATAASTRDTASTASQAAVVEFEAPVAATAASASSAAAAAVTVGAAAAIADTAAPVADAPNVTGELRVLFFVLLSFTSNLSHSLIAAAWLAALAEADRQYYEAQPDGANGYKPVAATWLLRRRDRVSAHLEKAVEEFRRRFIDCDEDADEERSGLLLLAYGHHGKTPEILDKRGNHSLWSCVDVDVDDGFFLPKFNFSSCC